MRRRYKRSVAARRPSYGSQRRAIGMYGSVLLSATNTSCSSCSRALPRGSEWEWRRVGDDPYGRFDLHALDLLAATSTARDFVERSTHVCTRWNLWGTCTALAAPRRAASAYAPPRSRTTTLTPGCALNHGGLETAQPAGVSPVQMECTNASSCVMLCTVRVDALFGRRKLACLSNGNAIRPVIEQGRRETNPVGRRR